MSVRDSHGGGMHIHDVTFDWADLSSVPEAVNSWA